MATPAGWYPTKTEPNLVRYWDGSAWTEHRRPIAQPAVVEPVLAAVAQSAVRAPQAWVAASTVDPVADSGSLFGSRPGREGEAARTAAVEPTDQPFLVWTRMAIALVSIGVSALILAFVLGQTLHSSDAEPGDVTTSGTVTVLNSHTRSYTTGSGSNRRTHTSTKCQPEAAFVVAGKSYTARLAASDQCPDLGDEAVVIYDPTDIAGTAHIPAASIGQVLARGLPAAFMVCVGLGLLRAYRAARRKR